MITELNGKYIKIKLTLEGTKTNIYGVFSHDNDIIGKIKWFGNFRKYAFFPSDGTVFDSKCLLDIIDFLNAIMEEKIKRDIKKKSMGE
jgi:hypothetical protein